MTHEELVARVNAYFPVVHHNQAEHCGYHYLIFHGEEAAKKVCATNAGHISVSLEDGELLYCLGLPPEWAATNFLEKLAESFENGVI